MKRKILIPFYHGGAGHLSNAKAIEHAICERRPQWEVKLVDPVEVLQAASLNRLYVEDWKRILAMPYPVQKVSFALNAAMPGVGVAVNSLAVSTYAEACADYVAAEKPDLVMSTHWGAAQLFCAGRKKLGSELPIWSLYYEFGEALPMYYSDADRVFFITSKVRQELIDTGHAPDRLTEIDLLAQPDMKRPLPSKAEARAALGIDPDKFTVMLSLGGEGIGNLLMFVSHYARRGSKAQMLVLTGRNAALLKRLGAFLDRNPSAKDFIVPYGFQPDIRAQLGAADIVAGKCGASFVSEVVCTRKPLAILQLGAPNEAGNRDYIIEHGYGWSTPTPRVFTALVERLASGDEEYGQTLRRMEGASRCEGAEQIAGALVGRFE
jgi:UDP-N-acetylglucosamine:LPS N-acetylglucosamine transferase